MCLLALTLLASLHSCPELAAPNFGAISCDKWEMGTKCAISCRRDYDIPQSVRIVPTLYICQNSTGKWNHDQVPDCEWREPSEKIRMPAYYYFSGNCNASRQVIKSNFLSVIDEYNAYPSEKVCTMENVSVTCGKEPDGLWKRSLGYRKRGRVIYRKQSKNRSG